MTSAKTTARTGAAGDRPPAQPRRGRVGEQGRPGLDRGPQVLGRRDAERRVARAATMRDHPPEPGQLVLRPPTVRPGRPRAAASSRCVWALTNPGTIATLPRSSSASRSLGRAQPADPRTLRSSGSRPRSADPHRDDIPRPDGERIAPHRGTPRGIARTAWGGAVVLGSSRRGRHRLDRTRRDRRAWIPARPASRTVPDSASRA